ncbi:MAG: polysaccharide biosynthesis protein [Oscillospiraceae bacterium]|nr:polysaccharide biosynthesis protein [Oscillospiraceae bacterium]
MKQNTTSARRQNFLEGAMILIIANIVIKLIGAIYKIPLKNLIGADGMGIYNTAYMPYAFLLNIAAAGVPVAASRMVAEAVATGRGEQAKRVFRITMAVMLSLGAALCLVELLIAKPFVEAIPNTRAYTTALVFAPALLFSAAASAYRGFYQGMSNMYPTAVSQTIEATVKLIVGYGLAYLAISRGASVEYAAAASAGGIVISTAASALYLALRTTFGKELRSLRGGISEKRALLAKKLGTIAVPVAVASSIMSLTNIIDMYIIQSRLQAIGYTESGASALYGIYETMCVSLMNLPQTLIVSLTVSLIPIISGSLATGGRDHAVRTTESGLRLTSVIGFPCAMAFFVLTEPLLALLFREDVQTAAPILRMMSVSTVFICFVSITNAVLQAIGREQISLWSMLAGAAVKLVVNYILIGIPSIGIYGAPIGTAVSYFGIVLFNLIVIQRSRVAPKRWGSILKPLLASFVMGAAVYFLYSPLSSVLGGKLAAIACAAAGIVIYAAALFFIRGIYREDIEMLPKGEKIANFLKLE